jgi:hypothetical protein
MCWTVCYAPISLHIRDATHRKKIPLRYIDRQRCARTHTHNTQIYIYIYIYIYIIYPLISLVKTHFTMSLYVYIWINILLFLCKKRLSRRVSTAHLWDLLTQTQNTRTNAHTGNARTLPLPGPSSCDIACVVFGQPAHHSVGRQKWARGITDPGRHILSTNENRGGCKIWGFHAGDYEELPSSLIRRRMDLVGTNVSEERIASVIRMKRIGELGKTLAVTSSCNS